MIKFYIDVKLPKGAFFMADTIKFNIIEMKSSALIIKGFTNQIEGIIKSIDRTITDICSEWEGAAYLSFMDDYRKLRPLTNSFVKMLEDLHKDLTCSADNMEKMDKDLANSIGNDAGLNGSPSTGVYGPPSPTKNSESLKTGASNASQSGSIESYLLKSGIKNGIVGTSDTVVGKKIIEKLPDETRAFGRLPASSGIGVEVEEISANVGIKAFKGFSRIAGPIVLLSYGYDVTQDCNDYDGGNRTGAIALTTICDGAAVVAGIGIAAIGAPVVVTVVLAVAATVVITGAFDLLKYKFLKKKKKE